MRYYLEKEITNSYKEGSLVIDILSKEDFINQYQKENHANHVIRHIGDIMYCKVELFYDVICGAFVIPDKKDLKIKHCFSFYLTEQKMIFIDDNDYVMKLIEKMKDTSIIDGIKRKARGGRNDCKKSNTRNDFQLFGRSKKYCRRRLEQ